MNKEKLEQFKNILLKKRSDILNRSKDRGQNALHLQKEDLLDENDHAAALVQQGLELEVVERDRILLAEIDRALSKFEHGTYGLCEDSEEPIDEARLEAAPWTRYSVEAQEEREQKAKRFAIR